MSIINHIYGALDDYMEESNTISKKLLEKRFEDMEILTQLLYEGIKRECYVFSYKDDADYLEHINVVVNLLDIIKYLINEYCRDYQEGKYIAPLESALALISKTLFELSHKDEGVSKDE